MLGWLKGKRSSEPDGDKKAVLSEALPTSEMHWIAGANLPIPDWSVQPWPDTGDDEALHRHANGQAASWLDATIAALPAGYQRAESEHFMLLSALAARPTRVLLDYLERSRNRVLGTLPGIATASGHGKTVVMVFAGEETYYHYISNYGGSSQPEAASGGMFVDAGYGHFVFAQGPFESMEPVVVHELTHCMVSHLPIPAWLNEGLAVNTEHRFVPRVRATCRASCSSCSGASGMNPRSRNSGAASPSCGPTTASP